jgi:hypothetical protein
MNTQPTPETNKISQWSDSHGWIVDLDSARRLERERDEAREQLAEIEDKMRVELGGHPNSELWGDAGLIAATMRCVDALDVVTEQRDRLAAVLQRIRDGYGGQVASPNCCEDCDYLLPIDETLQSLTQKP